MKNRREQGMALVTAILILLLLSTMIAGIGWLVLGDQKLGGNNQDRQLAFYGAEAGMESLTASLENLFDANYAPDGTAINSLLTTPGPPSNIQGVQYLAPGSTTPGSGYQIAFVPSTANANLPSTSWGTIPSGTYAGLVGLMTPYTLTVTSHTQYGSEVKLQRYVQTVGIPVFQFGFFSQTDLDFFAGPNFNFGGRIHTNGNLWLAEGNGNTLTMTQKTTTAGEIITANLENGWATGTTYTGAVNITNGSGVANLLAQNPSQSVTGAANVYGNIGAYAIGPPSFKSMANSVYNNNIGVAQTGVQPLNLAIATPSIGGQTIDLIRRPVAGENVSNGAKFQERYYSQVSLRILLSDYGANGTCATSDISSTSATALPGLAANDVNSPVDLATLAWDTSHATNAPAGLTAANVGLTVFPLPTSYAQGASYGADGYWVRANKPIITGCLKIDYQDQASIPSAPNWHDVTWDVLNYGFTGRNINPQINANNVPAYASPTNGTQPSLAGLGGQVASPGPTANAAVTTVGCVDPSPNAVIRLARLRDNPSTASGGNNGTNGNDWCGNNAANGAAVNTAGTWSGLPNKTSKCTTVTTPAPQTPNCPSQYGTDYWPNVLFDTREALLRDPNPVGLANNQLPVGGAMYYVELDAANLVSWFANDPKGKLALATNGFSVYFSDRRGDAVDPSPPSSVSAAAAKTGGYGWEDSVNLTGGAPTVSGCPNGTLDQGEDVEGDFTNGVDANPLLRRYGNVLSPAIPASLWPIALVGTQLGTPTALVNAVLIANPTCPAALNTWPLAVASNSQDLRENPPIFFRRALKVDDGVNLNALGTCNSVPCGLSIAAENPIYLQGDYNNPGVTTTFANAGVGAAIIGDAVTLLSDNWNDVNSFAFPYLSTTDHRVAHDTTYRVAVAAGKGIPFPNVNGVIYQDFGTDGGAHNFLRFLEDWGNSGPNGTLYYEGSIVSMYYNHQAVGTYKCCNNVYNPPGRAYQFDTNFLTPSLLPPLTPMLRTVNTVGFTQMLLPTQ